jgi:hypothetical protein
MVLKNIFCEMHHLINLWKGHRNFTDRRNADERIYKY